MAQFQIFRMKMVIFHGKLLNSHGVFAIFMAHHGPVWSSETWNTETPGWNRCSQAHPLDNLKEIWDPHKIRISVQCTLQWRRPKGIRTARRPWIRRFVFCSCNLTLILSLSLTTRYLLVKFYVNTKQQFSDSQTLSQWSTKCFASCYL